ncbi:MAG: DNA gyrase inhibitor YacG [Planctomycetota bacterium]
MSTELPLKRGRCPYCSTEYTYTSIAAFKTFPFCSSRCRDIDLGKWFLGNYAVPGAEGSGFGDDDVDAEMSPERDAT